VHAFDGAAFFADGAWGDYKEAAHLVVRLHDELSDPG
jgi:hypothetical protein